MNGANASTASATTATAELRTGYVGRFAPSPTGQLHLGSLTTALGSFLDARSQRGRWLLRIEDLDRPRVLPGAAADQIATLDRLGFDWDGPILYQSERLERYQQCLDVLRSRGLAYPCGCSRRELADSEVGSAYPGTCRLAVRGQPPYAMRLLTDDETIERFEDRLQGWQQLSLRQLGDPVIRRRDGLFAYQLAVVVDDADSGVTDVVRGADLLASSAWQRCLQRALGFAHPRWCHLPLVSDPDGAKLSKSRYAVPLDAQRASDWLLLALRILRQEPPPELRGASVRRMMEWASANWRLAPLRGLANVAAEPLPRV